MADTRHPPLPPGVPRPPMGQQPQGNKGPRPMGTPPGMPPRPMGAPPMAGRPPLPPGGKMPPRPMGAPPLPPGGKMPQRPMGAPPQGTPPPQQGQIVSPYGPSTRFQGEEQEIEDDLAELMEEEEEIIEEQEVEVEQKEEAVRFEPSPYDDNMAADMGLPASFIKTKILVPLFIAFLAIGIGAGMFIGNPRKVVSEELPGVVSNPEIPKGRPRCGLAQKGQGCVLYLMNAQRREAEAKEFFGMAADILGIPKFQIETANIRYATTRVPPGYIALFNIPPVQ